MKKRHILLIVLLVIAMFSGIVFTIISFTMKVMKGDAYEISLDNLYSNNEVTTLLGTPIEPSFFVLGSINISGDKSSADINYSVTGSINSAKVYVVASKELGLWTIEQQVVQISDTNTRIHLVDETPNKKPKHLE